MSAAGTSAPKKESLFSRLVVPGAIGLLVLILAAYTLPSRALLGAYLLNLGDDLVNRVARNSFLTVSMVVPVLAGLGLNFGIVLGAMAGQFALLIVLVLHFQGGSGFLLAAFLAVVLGLAFGYPVAWLYNRARGQEMIAGFISGYFANGVYQLVLLVLLGTLIPCPEPELLLPPNSDGKRVGIRNSLDLARVPITIKRADGAPAAPPAAGERPTISLAHVLDAAFDPIGQIKIPSPALPVAATVDLTALPPGTSLPAAVAGGSGSGRPLPLGTFAAILALGLAVRWFLGTKAGSDIRAVGDDAHAAATAGIAVDRCRTRAVLISTVLAALGQLVYLQNVTTLNTLSGHEQVGMSAAASLLVSGASISHATVGQAVVGTLLFNALQVTSATAGAKLMPANAQIGEYIRAGLAPLVIALALAVHALRQRRRDEV